MKENLVHVVETEQTRDGDFKVTLRGLTAEDRDNLKRIIDGLAWGRVNPEKRIETTPAVKGVPGPIDDELMLPFWRQVTAEELLKASEASIKRKPGNLPSGHEGIVVEHLCGYDYTPEYYRQVAKTLESYGFECLRSRRGADGRFWEIWYLCGLFEAKGALKDAVGDFKDEKSQMKVAIGFLCRTVSFGSLSVMSQRAAMVLD